MNKEVSLEYTGIIKLDLSNPHNRMTFTDMLKADKVLSDILDIEQDIKRYLKCGSGKIGENLVNSNEEALQEVASRLSSILGE